MPGADVVVEATRTGFEQYVEIKEKPATGGFSYTLPLKTDGLKVEQLKTAVCCSPTRRTRSGPSCPRR